MNGNLTRATSKKDCIAIRTLVDRTSATLKKLLIFFPSLPAA